jgi:hypothetical protein
VVEFRDVLELEIVNRALLAARFAEDPIDPLLLASPYLAIIHSSVVDDLAAAYRRDGKLGNALRLDEWRIFSKHRPEWNLVKNRLASPEMGWQRLEDVGAKRELLLTCFEPFSVADGLIDELIEELDQLTVNFER